MLYCEVMSRVSGSQVTDLCASTLFVNLIELRNN